MANLFYQSLLFVIFSLFKFKQYILIRGGEELDLWLIFLK